MLINNKDGTIREKVTVSFDPDVYRRLREYVISETGSITFQSTVINSVICDFLDYMEEEKKQEADQKI
jgi:hypothetical protein